MYHKSIEMRIKTLVYFVIVICCSCTSSDNSSIGSLPKKLSELDGWEGVKVEYGKRCPDCCDLTFPDTFAVNNERQLSSLVYLMSHEDMVYDLNCLMPLGYYILDHLVYISVNKQDLQAAKLLLDQKLYSQLNLDGELAEEFSGDRQIPVLEKSENLKEILTAEIIDNISDNICWWVMQNDGKQRIVDLIHNLEKMELYSFAKSIDLKCQKIWKSG